MLVDRQGTKQCRQLLVQRSGVLARSAAGLAAAALCWSAQAVGLGGIAVQSNLGQNLRATVALIGADDDDAALRACVKARLQTLDGATLAAPAISVARDGHGRMLQVSGLQKLYEPALTLVVELSCEGKSQREYTILLDPPEWPSAPSKMPLVGVALPSHQSVPASGASRPITSASSGAVGKIAGGAPARTGQASAPAKPAASAATAKARALASAPAVNPSVAPVTKPPAAPMRNVLRLSTDDVAAVVPNGAAGQKTNAASAPAAAPGSLADTEQKLREVQAKLMALDFDVSGRAAAALPKTGPSAETVSFSAQLDQTEQKMKDLRAKILALQIDTKNMSSKEPSLIPAVKPKPVAAVAVAAPPPSPTDNWLLIGLGVPLAACIAVIIAMMLRMRQLGKYTEHLGPY